ncbi:MAG: lipid-A-disaccharide synthase [Nitrosomonadales bacterium]|nr:lipid-A-disaccharide synthase [Nitrosomonadales bacterium]|tara:strand:- start:1626 stop:2771 length:1146 start_codon:yes stop_codon:yes gene_type:complete
MPKIAILAGEASGDLIGSQLMGHLNKKIKNVKFVGVGGPLMKKEGLTSYFNYSELSIHGYFEAYKNFFYLLSLRNKVIKYLLKEKPKIFIGIDLPDFNFTVEKILKENNIKTFHYVAPSVWAWRKNRIFSIKNNINHLFTVFPHEPKIFKKAKVPVTFVGHPLANQIPIKPSIKKTRKQLNLSNNKIITLLPGSRISEIKNNLDLMINSANLINKEFLWEKLKKPQFIIPINSKANYDFINRRINNDNKINNIKLMIGHSHEAICASDFVITVSGTATLEAALFKKPMIVVYKTSLISWLILKNMILIPYIGLPNILLKKFIVPEYLQGNATPEKISKKTMEIMQNMKLQKNLNAIFKELHISLKKNTAEMIYKKINSYLK